MTWLRYLVPTMFDVNVGCKSMVVLYAEVSFEYDQSDSVCEIEYVKGP